MIETTSIFVDDEPANKYGGYDANQPPGRNGMQSIRHLIHKHRGFPSFDVALAGQRQGQFFPEGQKSLITVSFTSTCTIWQDNLAAWCWSQRGTGPHDSGVFAGADALYSICRLPPDQKTAEFLRACGSLPHLLYAVSAGELSLWEGPTRLSPIRSTCPRMG